MPLSRTNYERHSTAPCQCPEACQRVYFRGLAKVEPSRP
jgi:hypothetical protein